MRTDLSNDVAVYLILAMFFALLYGAIVAGGLWLTRAIDRRAARRQWYRKSDAAKSLRHRMFRP